MGFQALQVLIYLTTPALALWLVSRSKVAATLSEVAICYLVGIFLANAHLFPIDSEVAMTAGGIAVLLAIPLLLFTVDVLAWLQSARVTVTASLIAFLSVGVVATFFGVIFFGTMDEADKIAGALAGVYTGGTPSMVAIAQALGISPERFIMVNLSDTMISGPFFFVLISVGPRLYGLALKRPEREPEPFLEKSEEGRPARVPPTTQLRAFLLAVGVAGTAIGLAQLAAEGIRDMVMILLASTIAIGASFSPRVRKIPGTFALGEYILLIFCTSIGSLADLVKLGGADHRILLLTAAIFFTSMALQYLLFWLLRVDRDTAIMAATASTFSPAFVGPVAARLQSKDAFISGITIGLIGYALATYLGIFVANVIPVLAAP